MSYKKWYDSHKEEFATKRRTRYANDPEYRKRQQDQARRHYWLNKRRAEHMPTEAEHRSFVSNDKISVLVVRENDIRIGMTLDVPVFKPADVANLLGRSIQTVRLWFTKGILPEILYRSPAGVRLYTQDQFAVLAKNANLLKLPTKNFEKHPFFVAVKDEWERLQPDGIEPMLATEWTQDPLTCPWCGATPRLQHFSKEKDRWMSVPCFACTDPYDVAGRKEKIKTVYVKGYCRACSTEVEKEMQMTGDNMVLLCDRCGSKIKEFTIS